MIKFTVKVMLAKREMTQKELAERTGIRPPTISAICVGSIKHLPVDALDKICEVLECQPSDLMEYVEDDKQNQQPLEPDPKGLFKDYHDSLAQGVIRSSRKAGMADEEILEWLKAFL